MDTLYIGNRIYGENGLFSGGILVSDEGKILNVFTKQPEINSWIHRNPSGVVLDYGNLVIMPGLIDSHVHINEPGRTEWEGFKTATKAAAAGGFTTIVDMPLNSIPPTTSVENLRAKTNAAHGKCYVDVGFWGGVIPENENELVPLVQHGVVGFKCFLCPSGVPEFPHVEEKHIEVALQYLENTGSVLAFHAEICSGNCSTNNFDNKNEDNDDPKKYETYLKSRPEVMEMEAIKLVTKLAKKYNVRTHIVHLSTADAIPLIRESRQNGAQITVETCHHYLNLAAEKIPDARTEYKCSPPIRSLDNQEKLWQAIVDRDIDMIVSDHSPSTPVVKLLSHGKNRGDFMRAWGGISSLQFGLSLFWTRCGEYGLDLDDLIRLMCTEPAKLCGLSEQKGKIAEGYDADFCIWNPEESFTITKEIVQFQNKANPYMGERLIGLVVATVVRGICVFHNSEGFSQPMGKLLLKKSLKRSVKIY